MSELTQPCQVERDDAIGAVYVYYSPDAQSLATLDVWGDGAVAADLDAAGQVIGLEILSLDEQTLQQARTFAASRELAFPRNLR